VIVTGRPREAARGPSGPESRTAPHNGVRGVLPLHPHACPGLTAGPDSDTCTTGSGCVRVSCP